MRRWDEVEHEGDGARAGDGDVMERRSAPAGHHFTAERDQRGAGLCRGEGVELSGGGSGSGMADLPGPFECAGGPDAVLDEIDQGLVDRTARMRGASLSNHSPSWSSRMTGRVIMPCLRSAQAGLPISSELRSRSSISSAI